MRHLRTRPPMRHYYYWQRWRCVCCHAQAYLASCGPRRQLPYLTKARSQLLLNVDRHFACVESMEQDICSLHSIYQASAESPEFIRVHLLEHIKALGNAFRKFPRYRCDVCLPRCASRQPPRTPLSTRISSPTPMHAVACTKG